MYDFIAIDFETANNNLASACSMGIVKVKNNSIVDTEHFFIRPPTMNFNPKNTSLHRITPDMVKNAPRFDELWKHINYNFLGEEIIVAHNAHFDMSVLMNCIIKYSLPIPDFTYMCSIPISTKACKHSVPTSLNARAKYFGISLRNHHNALDDAVACAQLVIKSIATREKRNLLKYCSVYPGIPMRKFSELKMLKSFMKAHHKFKRVPVTEISATTQVFHEGHPFFKKAVVLTGNLESMARKTAMQAIADTGGINRSSVSRKTDFLIVGTQDLALVGDDGTSIKERKAYELIEKGYDIKILNEQEFLGFID